ncbi:hypothetical protein D3C86_806800 [compost metagenome]
MGVTLQNALPGRSFKAAGTASQAPPSLICAMAAGARRTVPSSSVASTRTSCCGARPSSRPALTARLSPLRCAPHTGRVDAGAPLLANSGASRLPSATGDGSSRVGKRCASSSMTGGYSASTPSNRSRQVAGLRASDSTTAQVRRPCGRALRALRGRRSSGVIWWLSDANSAT